MVFNATFNNISVILWWSVLLVEETDVQTRNFINFPARGIFKNPREVIVNIFRQMALHKPKQLYAL